MIKDNEKYIIDGWAVRNLIDTIILLKTQIEKNHKWYTKDEFLQIIDIYDFTITYLLKLDIYKKQNDTYNEENEDEPDLPNDVKEFLKKMNIRLNSKNKWDENDRNTE